MVEAVSRESEALGAGPLLPAGRRKAGPYGIVEIPGVCTENTTSAARPNARPKHGREAGGPSGGAV